MPAPVRPCLSELRRVIALPSGVLGPVDFAAFLRLASSWAGEQVMGAASARVARLGMAGPSDDRSPAYAPRCLISWNFGAANRVGARNVL